MLGFRDPSLAALPGPCWPLLQKVLSVLLPSQVQPASAKRLGSYHEFFREAVYKCYGCGLLRLTELQIWSLSPGLVGKAG